MVQLQTLLALWNQKKVKKEEEEEEEDGGIDLSFLSFFLWSWEPGGLAVAHLTPEKVSQEPNSHWGLLAWQGSSHFSKR